MECPSKECHANVQQMRKAISEIKNCMNKKVSTALVVTFLAVVLTLSGSFILYGLAAEKEQNKTMADNKEQIAIIRTDLKHIAENQREMKETIKRIEDKQITKTQLVETIKRAIGK